MGSPIPSPATPGTMKASTFEAFRRLVHEQCGISLGESKLALVSSRISKRMRQLGMQKSEEYLEFLRQDDDAEMVLFLDAISTNVTSFFREAMHFRFVQEQMGSWLGEGQKRFRFWSAACSTGEEPLTLAMVLTELFAGQQVDWRILATDISTRALLAAQRGLYSENTLKSVPPTLRSRYFAKHAPAGSAEVVSKASAEIHERIMWRRVNLSQPPFPLKGNLDIVFCRNVMIYFDDTVRRRLVRDFCRLLKPGGILIVGAAESLSGMMDGYRLVQPSVYCKV